jgi:hypothetical protein
VESSSRRFIDWVMGARLSVSYGLRVVRVRLVVLDILLV